MELPPPERINSGYLASFLSSFLHNSNKLLFSNGQILMDFMSAGSIRDLIEETQTALTEEQVAFVCRESLKGLLYLHASNIIHRCVAFPIPRS